jgi:hypothetical protein
MVIPLQARDYKELERGSYVRNGESGAAYCDGGGEETESWKSSSQRVPFARVG